MSLVAYTAALLGTPMNRKIRFLLAPALLLLAATSRADGELDSAFGNNGQVMLVRAAVPATSDALVGDVAVLPNGKSVWVMENGFGSALVGRLNRDGSPDQSFGAGGELLVSTCSKRRPTRLLPLSDGGLLVWGGACLFKLSATGTMDGNFGIGATVPPTATFQRFLAADLAADSVGRILLAGYDGELWQVYRYLAEGSNDLSFGSNGIATVAQGNATQGGNVAAMQVLSDNKIVLVGARSTNFRRRLRLAQLDASGNADPLFGDNGITEVEPPNQFHGLAPEALALDRDGSLLVSGDGSGGATSCCVMIARFSRSGELVANSLKLFQLGVNVSLSPFGETANALTIASDGKILLARNSFPFPLSGENTRTRFTLIRLLKDGTLDSTFDQDGWRSYVVRDPSGSGQSGPYTQLHAVAFDQAEALMFGRTFFEDNSLDLNYVTLLRVRFELIFSANFD